MSEITVNCKPKVERLINIYWCKGVMLMEGDVTSLLVPGEGKKRQKKTFLGAQESVAISCASCAMEDRRQWRDTDVSATTFSWWVASANSSGSLCI